MSDCHLLSHSFFEMDMWGFKAALYPFTVTFIFQSQKCFFQTSPTTKHFLNVYVLINIYECNKWTLIVTGIYCVLLGCVTLLKTRSWIKEMDGRSMHDPWCLQSKCMCVCVWGVDVVCMYHMSVKWNNHETLAFLNLSPRLGPWGLFTLPCCNVCTWT